MKAALVVLFGVVLAAQIHAAKLPSNIPRCKFEDTPCFENAVDQSIKIMKAGNPKINLAPLDPLHVTAINIETGSGNFKLKLDLSESDIAGLSQIKDIKIESKSDKILHWILTGYLPKITFQGHYNAAGQILVLPVQGNGDSTITLNEVEARMVIKEADQKVERKGKKYIQLEQFDVKFTPKSVSMNFENLFNGDKTLGDNLNLFINENWQEVFKEVQPALEESIGAIFLEVTNRVFNKVPVEDVYL